MIILTEGQFQVIIFFVEFSFQFLLIIMWSNSPHKIIYVSNESGFGQLRRIEDKLLRNSSTHKDTFFVVQSDSVDQLL